MDKIILMQILDNILCILLLCSIIYTLFNKTSRIFLINAILSGLLFITSMILNQAFNILIFAFGGVMWYINYINSDND